MLQYFMRSPLEEGHPYVFGDWPIKSVPTGAAGIYTIWREHELIYVGMAGRGKTEADLAEKPRMPKSKLNGCTSALVVTLQAGVAAISFACTYAIGSLFRR